MIVTFINRNQNLRSFHRLSLSRWLTVCRLPLLAVAVSTLFFQCEQSFNPMGPLDQQLVAFTVLSTDRDMQIVRVTAPSMQPGVNPGGFESDNVVNDAVAIIVAPGYWWRNEQRYWHYAEPEQYNLRDTILSNNDAAGRNFSFHVMVARPFVPKRGITYQVYVGSNSHGSASGPVVMPGQPHLERPSSTWNVLSAPFLHLPEAPIDYVVTPSDTAKGYVGRLYIDYDVLKGTEWVAERVELPLSSPDTASYALHDAVYPTLTSSISQNPVKLTYRNGYLRSIIKDITTVRYPANRFAFKWVTFVLLQIDANLYSYCAATQVDRDLRSIRLDQPLYPKVNGGAYGMFGAYTLDSLVDVLPEDFSGNRK